MANDYKLTTAVMQASVGKTWEEAVQEWEIIDCEEEQFANGECICGHDHLRYLYTIRNRANGNVLYPIGSECIKKFERDDLDQEISIMQQKFALVHAVERGKRIDLHSEYFSRRLLLALYQDGAFQPNQYNGYNGYNDYLFLLDIFNKRSCSYQQDRKVQAIIVKSIKPYLHCWLHMSKRKK